MDANDRVASNRSPRETGQVPPPPSRAAQPNASQYAGGGYVYDSQGARGTTEPIPSHQNSLHNLGYPSNPYGDDVYQSYYSNSSRSVDRRLGEVNPNEIEDDGDDGLNYHPRYSQRNSMLSSLHNSDRGARSGAAAAGTAGGVTMGGLMGRRHEGDPEYNLAEGVEKKRGKKDGLSKRGRWIIIIGVALLIIGVVVAGVVGGMVANNKKQGDDHSTAESAKEDAKSNGDLDADSNEIKELLNNPDLHKVFRGMDYTPLNAQYPDCVENPPSQNNITRDIAVLSQLTNKVRLYGTDCNQTEMVLHSIKKLKLEDDVKVWLGVWQDGNATTSKRQLQQMWNILDEYGQDQFEGLIVANEILFREEMTITELGNVLDDVRSNLTKRNMDLPVATSDLGDDWTKALAAKSDYIMSNIHPFFAGTPSDNAAAWTMSFWENNNGPMFKSDKQKNIISETGWPTGGGTNCGTDAVTKCAKGSVASVDGLNQFLEDFVCQALKNGTNYFWFSAFDEPWKIRYNEKGKNWEDKWGLMDVNRNIKDGVKIPDCDGKEVPA
ncbi:Glycosyl hydrolases family 17 [Geosmithia morbida]|uniref:glucan endo-1,3-beta-D-glucosidase n=1 Tax=Geosmithia morbida TaxID=1094350 RepID=A0A9P4YQH5_9HYPO|nr:Glycosyl hydrolases family 17 [Geosmithia morbida]KAF4119947.1 Glycosyl hydrolases family 17 [Geosmithia morbida]